MIKTFADETTAALFDDRPLRAIDDTLRRKVRRKLMEIDAIQRVEEFGTLPGSRLENYSYHRSGKWSIAFHFENGDAWDVQFRDYQAQRGNDDDQQKSA